VDTPGDKPDADEDAKLLHKSTIPEKRAFLEFTSKGFEEERPDDKPSRVEGMGWDASKGVPQKGDKPRALGIKNGRTVTENLTYIEDSFSNKSFVVESPVSGRKKKVSDVEMHFPPHTYNMTGDVDVRKDAPYGGSTSQLHGERSFEEFLEDKIVAESLEYLNCVAASDQTSLHDTSSPSIHSLPTFVQLSSDNLNDQMNLIQKQETRPTFQERPFPVYEQGVDISIEGPGSVDSHGADSPFGSRGFPVNGQGLDTSGKKSPCPVNGQEIDFSPKGIHFLVHQQAVDMPSEERFEVYEQSVDTSLEDTAFPVYQDLNGQKKVPNLEQTLNTSFGERPFPVLDPGYETSSRPLPILDPSSHPAYKQNVIDDPDYDEIEESFTPSASSDTQVILC
jgi:hypothetical protein